MRSITRLMTPWYRWRPSNWGTGPENPGSSSATAILDYTTDSLVELAAKSREQAAAEDEVAVLAAAHSAIRERVSAVYSVEERIPASQTFERGFGSCSQRLAILESVARAIGVRTRVHGMLIDRSFWYARFPQIKFALPERILLAWPEFHVNEWRSAGELFGPLGCRSGTPFTNRGSETLFEAVGRCAVDWSSVNAAYDLSHFVVADCGYFADRDELFAQLGQTLTSPALVLADPILRCFPAR